MNNLIYINGRYLTQKVTGVQRNAYELTRHLLLLKAPIKILIPNQALNLSYDVVDWPLQKIGFSHGILWEQLDVPLFLLSVKTPLLVNLTNTAPIFYKKQIISIMDMTTFINPSWFTKKFVKYYQFLLPIISKNSLKILTISKCSSNDILHFLKVKENKVRVIYCGVSEIFLNQMRYSINNTILSKFGLISKGYLLAVSSLDPRKNFSNLINAYLELKSNFPLVIVGSNGKVFNNIGIEINTQNDNIVFTGYLTDSDLVQLYKHANCFIYPSLYEGFGIPPLEAMACGCPTIVSSTSSMPEICANATIYIDPYNKESIKEGITKLANNQMLRQDLIEKGFQNVKRFSWEKSSIHLFEEINKIA